MVSRRTNFGEGSEPAPNRGGKLQSAGGGGEAAQSNVSPLGRWDSDPLQRVSHRCPGHQVMLKNPFSNSDKNSLLVENLTDNRERSTSV